ncbi:TAXI family TRAP transporter solute-binding subunit [Micrococcus sp. NPDC078436]|uniref:TAXI family TRAP transporter solute-binding subunit n=1 Tax=Micrococcus sp. NPDC078436 TaxID=3154960 RepID=UPI00344C0697
MALSRRRFILSSGAAAALTAVTGCAPTDGTQQSVWSTYGVGTGTYNDLAAVANTLTQVNGRQVRLMTSSTGMGRMAPLINGTADLARSGDEYFYAFEGDDEFCSSQWGPQPIRQVWSPRGNYGVLVRKDSGIETVEDLRGRNYPNLVGATSINRKLEAFLNYGGLTRADTNLVNVSYAGQVEALKTGQINALYQNVVGSNIEELASQYPVRWLDLSSDDPSRFASWKRLAPIARPGRFTDGAGLAEGESAVNMQYSIPLATVAARPADEVTTLVTQIHENFDKYRTATQDAKMFALDKIMFTPMVVPFHEGAIAFFKDKGVWTPHLQRRHEALLDREGRLKEAWPVFLEAHDEVEKAAQQWFDWKQENLPDLPPVEDLPEDDATSTDSQEADA